MKRDRIYAIPANSVGDFQFDDRVADVFPDMISRSVPGYASILAMIADLSEKYAKPDSVVWDLGCSLGAATLLMRSRIPASCTLMAVDNAPAMVSRLQERLRQLETEKSSQQDAACRIQVLQKDIRNVQFERVSFVVLNMTLQFLPMSDRAGVLQAAFDGMQPGGALLLAEKIKFEDPGQQQLLTELHHNFKRAHGYSDLEIAQKRTAIENCLIPETLDDHISRLKEIGFRTVAPWFQCFNFASLLAVKE